MPKCQPRKGLDARYQSIVAFFFVISCTRCPCSYTAHSGGYNPHIIKPLSHLCFVLAAVLLHPKLDAYAVWLFFEIVHQFENSRHGD